MHDSRMIANEFLSLASKENKPLTIMQVLKLVYIAHGWSLGLYSRPLISDEVEAWQYGPVIPRLYQAIKDYRHDYISEAIRTDSNTSLDEREGRLVAEVYEIYGGKSGPALSRITHAKGTPWDLVYEPGAFGMVIPNDLIHDHYTRLANKAA